MSGKFEEWSIFIRNSLFYTENRKTLSDSQSFRATFSVIDENSFLNRSPPQNSQDYIRTYKSKLVSMSNAKVINGVSSVEDEETQNNTESSIMINK